jgi:hypothetical protein
MPVKPLFQLSHFDMRSVAIIKLFEREAELRPKLVQAYLGKACLAEDIIGGLPNCWQIVHQRTRPIENNVPNHLGSLMMRFTQANGYSPCSANYTTAAKRTKHPKALKRCFRTNCVPGHFSKNGPLVLFSCRQVSCFPKRRVENLAYIEKRLWLGLVLWTAILLVCNWVV